MDKAGARAGDALQHVRAAAQELHRAFSDTLARRASTTKAEIEGLINQVKTANEAAQSAIRTQQGTIKQQLVDAAERLDAARKHATEGLKSSGEALHTSLTKALADVRAATQKISEAVAGQRSEQAAKQAAAKRAS